MSKILVTICARGGSKGLPSKNIRSLLGKPLIVHSIEQALAWPQTSRVLVSTDSQEIAEVAKNAGASVPFLRPSELATDQAPKVPVIVHAWQEAQRLFKETYTAVLDLDPTAPIRSQSDLDQAWKTATLTQSDLCFSVVKARKNPYFNMVERDETGKVRLSKSLPSSITSRQAAPKVWDMNASIYVYSADFLNRSPKTLWEAQRIEFFEMPSESAFDIDEERDFRITEALLSRKERAPAK